MTEVAETIEDVLDSNSSQMITIGKTKLRVRPAPVVGAHLKVRWEFRDDVEIEDIMKALPHEFQRREVAHAENSSWITHIGSYGHLYSEESKYETEKLENGDEVSVRIEKIISAYSDRTFSVMRSEGKQGYLTIKSSEWEEREPFIPCIEIKVEPHTVGATELLPEHKTSRLFLEAEITKDNIEAIGKLEALRGKDMKVTWCYSKKTEYENTECSPALG